MNAFRRHLLGASSIVAALVLVAGCGASPEAAQTSSGADLSSADDPGDDSGELVTTEDALVTMYRQAQHDVFPELDDATFTYAQLSGDDNMFTSDVVPETAVLDGADRTYRFNYNPLMFQDPPDNEALYAILVHELRHTMDYRQMDSLSLISFAITYATEDVTAYEHQTDLAPLEDGLSVGLKSYRYWLYAHIGADALQAKETQYYTPDQIDVWVSENPQYPQRAD